MVDMGIKTVSREVVIGNKIKSIFIHKNLTVGSHRPWLENRLAEAKIFHPLFNPK